MSSVTVTRIANDIPVFEIFNLQFRQDGRNIDEWDIQKWMAPGCVRGEIGVKAPGDPRERGTGIHVLHLLTPETDLTTHYSFSAVRHGVANGMPATPEIATKIGELRRRVFIQQDGMMINAQQSMIERFPKLTQRPALFSIDAGPSRFASASQNADADPESAPISPMIRRYHFSRKPGMDVAHFSHTIERSTDPHRGYPRSLALPNDTQNHVRPVPKSPLTAGVYGFTEFGCVLTPPRHQVQRPHGWQKQVIPDGSSSLLRTRLRLQAEPTVMMMGPRQRSKFWPSNVAYRNHERRIFAVRGPSMVSR